VSMQDAERDQTALQATTDQHQLEARGVQPQTSRHDTRAATPDAKPSAPMPTSNVIGFSSSAHWSARHVAPSRDTIPHLTGLRSLTATIHSGISESGTIAPPSIAIRMSVAQPAPATA